ncbi:FeoA family protein [Parendozoicomonas haliclonae]|uniref:Ferrous iron transport protein A n=1 Tax=Parendozoicomonas haliclonae TaxID=1960125 RepID=A0A1X7AS10_9GAMM|nr:ferrous iron transport protein A [Parendozoicomonas haliclonae]SMA50933.1 Ferrous iron transport protein A [Parendozoicomonas haliclonae]
MSLTLGDLAVGDQARISGYTGGGNYRRQLLAMGLTPGIALKVIRRAPMGDPVELEVRGFSLSLRRDEAQCVLIDPLSKDQESCCGTGNRCCSR